MNRWLAFALMAAALDGRHARAGDESEALDKAGDALDRVERHAAEWGHASFSGVVLVPDEGNFFDLNYSVSMSNYVANAAAATQGQAGYLAQSQLAGQLQLQAANAAPGLNVAKIPAATGTNAAAGSGPTNTTPALPDVLSNTIPSAITNGFAPPGKVFSGPSANQLSDDTILKLAATAKENERVLNFMSHPINLPDNKRVFFAVGQISVMPGWRTREGYSCEVIVHCDYADYWSDIQKEAKNSGSHWAKAPGLNQKYKSTKIIYANSGEAEEALGRWGDTSPISLVAAFPFTEAQVFDEQNSYRNQINLMINLAASYMQAGYTAEAKMLLNYVKQVQKDLSTRTAFPTVIPGVAENTLTYRFDPETAAMTDPSQNRPTAGNILLPTSIPVLILVEADAGDADLWSKVGVNVETRWIPKHEAKWYDYITYPFGHRPTATMHPSGNLDDAEDLDKAWKQYLEVAKDYDNPKAKSGARKRYETAELYRRLSMLDASDQGSSVLLNLPTLPMVITAVSPTNLDAHYSGSLTIIGNGLKRLTDVRLISATNSYDLKTIPKGEQEATTVKNRFAPGVYDLVTSNCYLPQALTVTGTLQPVITAISPTNFDAHFDGSLAIIGRNLARLDKVRLISASNSYKLKVKHVSDAEATTEPVNVAAGTYDLVTSNSYLPGILTVTGSRLPSITAIRPSSVVLSQNPAANPVQIVLLGANFDWWVPAAVKSVWLLSVSNSFSTTLTIASTNTATLRLRNDIKDGVYDLVISNLVVTNALTLSHGKPAPVAAVTQIIPSSLLIDSTPGTAEVGMIAAGLTIPSSLVYSNWVVIPITNDPPGSTTNLGMGVTLANHYLPPGLHIDTTNIVVRTNLTVPMLELPMTVESGAPPFQCDLVFDLRLTNGTLVQMPPLGLRYQQMPPVPRPAATFTLNANGNGHNENLTLTMPTNAVESQLALAREVLGFGDGRGHPGWWPHRILCAVVGLVLLAAVIWFARGGFGKQNVKQPPTTPPEHDK